MKENRVWKCNECGNTTCKLESDSEMLKPMMCPFGVIMPMFLMEDNKYEQR